MPASPAANWGTRLRSARTQMLPWVQRSFTPGSLPRSVYRAMVKSLPGSRGQPRSAGCRSPRSGPGCKGNRCVWLVSWTPRLVFAGHANSLAVIRRAGDRHALKEGAPVPARNPVRHSPDGNLPGSRDPPRCSGCRSPRSDPGCKGKPLRWFTSCTPRLVFAGQ